MKFTERERELLLGMIDVQMHHATRAQLMNKPMGEKQYTWDMERVDLLKKILIADNDK